MEVADSQWCGSQWCGSMFSWPAELKAMWQMAGRVSSIGPGVQARQIHQTVVPEMHRDPGWDDQGVCLHFLHP